MFFSLKSIFHRLFGFQNGNKFLFLSHQNLFLSVTNESLAPNELRIPVSVIITVVGSNFCHSKGCYQIGQNFAILAKKKFALGDLFRRSFLTNGQIFGQNFIFLGPIL